MTKHIIKNYDQVKAHLTALSKAHNGNRRDYLFAVGDTFNENVPPGVQTPTYTGQAKGIGGAEYNRRIGQEIDRLLDESGTDMARAYLQTQVRVTARAWPKEKRTYDTSFSVYFILRANKDLMRDGLTVTKAGALLHGRQDNSAELDAKRIDAQSSRIKNAFNPVQSMRIGINTWRGVTERVEELDGDEARELIGEAYAVLDSLCERLGINMYDDAELVAA